MFQPDLLKGKRILVTGGGTGLGRSMAQRYLELGANVVICGRREDVLKQTAEELAKATGGEIETVGCDVRVADAVEAMMDKIWAKRPLDVLVNNAAGQILAQTNKMSTRAIDSVLGIVLHGSAYCTVAAGRRWIDAGLRDRVVMSILTVSSLMGAPFTVPSVAMTAMRPCGAAAIAASAPGSITPMTGIGCSVAVRAGSAVADAVLQATTSSLMRWAVSARAHCTA